MKFKAMSLVLATSFLSIPTPIIAASQDQLQAKIQQLQEQTKILQRELVTLKKQIAKQPIKKKQRPSSSLASKSMVSGQGNFHESPLLVHTIEPHPESISFYPTALVSRDQIITYIAGTPIVTAPYLGARPAFDGSDYIINISSINRDIRLMQQRRSLFRAYEKVGYPPPNVPIVALSGKAEPIATFNRPQIGNSEGDVNLGSSEVDVAAILNKNVEAFIAIAYDDSPPDVGPRVSNSAFNLHLGFVNIGDLDQSPFYFTAGQLFVPYGRYSSAMISSALPLTLGRIKTRPVILGYKSQRDSGPYAAIYSFLSDLDLGHDAVGGVNLGYIFGSDNLVGDFGAGLVGSLSDSQGMQANGSPPFTTFGGFGSATNGSECIRKIPGLNFHANVSFDRYNLTAEWLGASRAFRPQDLSFNGRGAKPEAMQFEGEVTFKVCGKPAAVALGYQWSSDALALNLPRHRALGVFNISIWKDTVESIEYRHDIDYGIHTYANGAAPPGLINANTFGTGKTTDTVTAQIGVYF